MWDDAPKNWCFKLWWWRRLLTVPWTARRLNQSMLKEINTEYSLEGLMLKLKPQYFGHLMERTDSLEKTLMLGKIEGRRRREWQKTRWLDGITDSNSWVCSNSFPSLGDAIHRSKGATDGWHHWEWKTWVWTNSSRHWNSGKPGVLQFMRSQRVQYGLATE